jgi:hypothetical protein
MVGEVLTLPQLEEGVFIVGWKSGHWRQPELQLGDKFGAAGPWVRRSGGRSGGTRHLAGSPAARRADPAVRRKAIQNYSPAAPPNWSGQPPDGPAVDQPLRRTSPLLAGDYTIFLFAHENPFTCELKPVCIHFKY